MFSFYPNHFDVILDSEILKKVQFLHILVNSFAIIIFPFPGGPNSKITLIGYLRH